MEASERLVGKARDYELLAESHAERAPLDDGHGGHRAAAIAFSLAAIVLREVAAALEMEEAA
jgi:hypothetical protein